MRKISLYELRKKNNCSKAMSRNLQFTEEKNLNYYRATGIVNIIKNAMSVTPHLDDVEIAKQTDALFSSLDYANEENRKKHCEDAFKFIRRYVSSDKRDMITNCPRMKICIDDFEVDVCPDLIYKNDDNHIIEIIKIDIGKPDVSQDTSDGEYDWMGNKKTIAGNYKPLYALFSYGKELIPIDSTWTVRASIYFLRQKTDDLKNAKFGLDFFDPNGKNVVYLMEEVTRDSTGNITPGLYDSQFAPLFKNFAEGKHEDDCDKNDCLSCELYDICKKYKKSPQYEDKIPVVKSLKDLDLTEAQEKAMNYKKGVCRINAGAGAGKTLVVALRVVNLLLSGVKPEEILMLTFTKTGADEMKERIQLYNDDFGTGSDVSGVTCTTFNGFGNDQIIKEYDKLGFLTPPTVIDNIERSAIIAEELNKHPIKGLDYRNFNMNERRCKGALAMTQLMFDIIKKEELTVGDENKLKALLKTNVMFISLTALTPALELYNEYDMTLKNQNLIEYSDQEVLLNEILRQDPFYFEKMGIKHIIVDEFQDSSLGQIELIKKFKSCPSFESLMVVGDDSQAIFSFRDTTPEYIIHFDDIMGCPIDDIYLLENHRSTPEIIDYANKLNALNKDRIDKDLIATRPSGKKPIVRGFFDKKEEYDYICDSIQEMLTREENPYKPEDIAFIAKDKFELMTLGDRLTEKHIPWVMLNPEPLLENGKVLGAIALAKAFLQPDAGNLLLSYLNALYEGELLNFTDADITKLVETLQNDIKDILMLPEKTKRMRLHEMLMDIDDDDEVYQAFIEKVEIRPFFDAQIKYMKSFEIYGKNETYRRTREYPGVILTTAHSSKGLEWPVVFNSVTKYYEKDIAHNNKAIEENRRLLFVSATRARDELIITGQIISYGDKKDRYPNKFLKESYDILGYEFSMVDPNEEEREAAKAAEKAARVAARKASAKGKLLSRAGVAHESLEDAMARADAYEEAEEIEKAKQAELQNKKVLAVKTRTELEKKTIC